MDKRYKMFAKRGVKDIFRYNEKYQEQKDEKLPQIVIIIDELAGPYDGSFKRGWSMLFVE